MFQKIDQRIVYGRQLAENIRFLTLRVLLKDFKAKILKKSKIFLFKQYHLRLLIRSEKRRRKIDIPAEAIIPRRPYFGYKSQYFKV